MGHCNPPNGVGRLASVDVALSVLLMSCATGADNAPHRISSEPTLTGSVVGVVTFIGADCKPAQPTFSVPPCSGPYPRYDVVLLHLSNLSEAAKATTDTLGRYSVAVAPGRYLIRVPRDETLDAVPLTVEVGMSTRVDLSVDSGIR